jgi:hypothetical protein
MDQGYGHHGKFEIRGAFDGVACEDSQTATVGGDLVGEAYFHGKIGYFRFIEKMLPVTHWHYLA